MVHHVVIIGGGFAGLKVAHGLRHAPCQITLIDKTNSHVFQPLLYQVATASLTESSISKPIREIFKDQENLTVRMANVIDIDRVEKKIKFHDGAELTYDTLVVATGARHSYFGNAHYEAFAPGLKTIEDAYKIKERLLIAFERAESSENPQLAMEHMVFVIIGAGPTGVELAGSIAELKNVTLRKNFRHIDPNQARVILIEGFSDVLPSYPQSLRVRARKDLEKLGVEVLTDCKVTNIFDHGVDTEKGFIHAEAIIWAAGNEASPLLRSLHTELDRQGRAIVEPDCTIKDDSSVYVIGDAAHFKGKNGLPLPSIAPAAIQMGVYVGKCLKKRLEGNEFKKPFSYFDKGSMATIGSYKAVVVCGCLKLKGFIAWLAWLFIHLIYLVSFRNRLMVALDWTIHYLSGRSRHNRVIVRPIDELDSKEP
ncbi:MAG: NAD(P)/FAD-dependent oxidoreductase [Chlamydiia bacterium]